MKLTKTLSYTALLLLLNACGENSLTTITKDVTNLSIESGPTYSMYSTDLYSPQATVDFDDNTSEEATDNVDWTRSNSSMLYLSNELTILPLVNDGNSTLSIKYKNFDTMTDSVNVDIVGLDSNTSWSIKTDANTTGDSFILVAEGNFTDGNTSKTIVQNISWTSSNTAIATVTSETRTNTSASVNKSYTEFTLNTLSAGDVNITATLNFGDMNASLSKEFTLN